MQIETLKNVSEVIKNNQKYKNNLNGVVPKLTASDLEIGFKTVCNITRTIDYREFSSNYNYEYKLKEYQFSNIWVLNGTYDKNCMNNNSKMVHSLYSMALKYCTSFYTLLPSRVATPYWYEYCRFADVVFLPSLIELNKNFNKAERAIVIFNPEMHKRTPTTQYLEL